MNHGVIPGSCELAALDNKSNLRHNLIMNKSLTPAESEQIVQLYELRELHSQKEAAGTMTESDEALRLQMDSHARVLIDAIFKKYGGKDGARMMYQAVKEKHPEMT